MPNCPHCTRPLETYNHPNGQVRCTHCAQVVGEATGEPDVALHDDLAPMVIPPTRPVRPSDDGHYDRISAMPVTDEQEGR